MVLTGYDPFMNNGAKSIWVISSFHVS